MAGGFFENLFGGGLGAYGYDQLMGDMKDQQKTVAGTVGDLQTGSDQRSQFQPWGVTSGMGNTQGGPGGIDYNLSQGMQGIQDNMFGMGQDMLGRAGADPAMREQEIYDRMRAAQLPGEERQQGLMNERLYNTGRAGGLSDMYGGTGEQFAFEKARAEAQNQAMLGAMGQTQNELMNQYTMGSGMMGQGYMPMQQLQAQAGLGLNNAQLGQNSQLNAANQWTQLGLGGLTADTNYSNIQGNAFGNMISALMPAAAGLGGVVDQGVSGLWDWLQKP